MKRARLIALATACWLAAWQPVFDRHRVDLVLQGHDHSYARTSLEVGDTNEETGVQARSAEAGTVYVVSVSGPKMYELGNRDRFPRVAEDTQLYQIITVDGDELRYEARTANGTLYCIIVMSCGSLMACWVTVFSFAAMAICATSSPDRPCFAFSSSASVTGTCAVAWHA